MPQFKYSAFFEEHLWRWQIDGETVETVADFIFWAPKSLQMVITAMKLKDVYYLEEKL